MCAQLCKELGTQYLDFQGLNKNRNELQAEEDCEILQIMGEQGPTEAGHTSRVYCTCSENDLPESAQLIPISPFLTDVTKMQVFICSASLSLSCDCLRRMRNNIDDHGQRKTSQKPEKEAIRKQNQAQYHICLPCFSQEIIFTFAAKMEGGAYSSRCIFQKQILQLTGMNSVNCFQQRMYYFTFISMSRKPELLLQ